MRFLDRRPLLIVAGWLLAVVLAVVVGVVGIGLVGADLTSRQGAPVSEEQVARELQALPSTVPSSAPPSAPAPASSSASASTQASETPPAGQSFVTRGGTVVADCARILSMAPAQGFEVVEQDDDDGEFRSVSDPSDRIEIDLECIAGVPQVEAKVAD